MNLASVRAGDLIRVARNGEPTFHAEVLEQGPAQIGTREPVELRRGELWVQTLVGGHGRIVTARQVEEHWRRRRSRP